MSHTRRHALITLGAAAAALAGTRSWAQDTWPSKAINYVVPFTPGGSTDVVGRVLAEKLAGPLGQPVVVDNKPGAAGAVGASYVAKAKPDGYTLFGGTISTHAINASLYKNPATTRSRISNRCRWWPSCPTCSSSTRPWA